jgi:pyruvate,water dikinase
MFMRGSFAEFVPEPVSPLFATLAVPIARDETQKMIADFFNVKDLARTGYLFEVINGYVYIGLVMSAEILWKMTVLSIVKAKDIFKASKARWAVVRGSSRALAARWQSILADPAILRATPAPRLLAGVRELFLSTAAYYTVAQSGPIPLALSSETVFSSFYRALVRRKTDPEASAFLLGLDTIPLRAEKSLYDLAMWVKGQPEVVKYLQHTSLKEVCAALKVNPIPEPIGGDFAGRLKDHLAAFGHAIYDLDFTKPVPADDPAPVLEGIKAYVAGQAGNPYERQRAQVERREKAAQAILAKLDPLRRKWFIDLLKWAQDSGPDREDCIADMGLCYPQLRGLLRELGRRLAEGGAISQAEDVYWLEAQELDAMAAALEAGDTLTAQADKIEGRKAFWQRARRSAAPVSIPEKTFFTGLLIHENPEGDTLKGYPASGGKVTARACVLHGPDEFGNMRPGDVIVAVTTTPAWTPLFAMASAVVTDIGGPLSHSSIVAREYGIPAVMATGVASRRIRSGQTITVDGSKGIVIL